MNATTIFANDDMDTTLTQSVLRKKFGSKDNSDFNTVKSNIPNSRPNTTVFGNDDMEVTLTHSDLIKKFGSKTDKMSEKNITTHEEPIEKLEEMDMTSKIEITEKSSIVPKDDDITRSIPKALRKKIASLKNSENCSFDKDIVSPLDSVSEGENDEVIEKSFSAHNDKSMEMTCTIQSQLGTSMTSKIELNTKPCEIVNVKANANLRNTEIPTSMSDGDGNVLYDKSFIAHKDDDDEEMEMTCAVSKEIRENVKQVEISSTSPIQDMEITCPVSKIIEQRENTQKDDYEEMEMTCAVSKVTKEFRENVKQVEKLPMSPILDMEKSCSVPKLIKQNENVGNVEQEQKASAILEMSMTCSIPKINTQHISENVDEAQKSMKVPMLENEDMEMTCHVSKIIKQKEVDKKFEQEQKRPTVLDMEMTCSVPKMTKRQISENFEHVGKFMKSPMLEEDMEMTCHVSKITKQKEVGKSAEQEQKDSSMIDMEVTCSIPKTTEQQNSETFKHVQKNMKSPLLEDDMEMTCHVSKIIKQKEVGKEAEQKQKNSSMLDMEMTCSIPTKITNQQSSEYFEHVEKSIKSPVLEEDMEMTCHASKIINHKNVGKKTEQEQNDSSMLDMEMTCSIPKINKQKFSGNIKQVQKSMEQPMLENDMEMTCHVSKVIKQIDENAEKSLDIEATKQILSKNENVEPIQKSSTPPMMEEDMAITCHVTKQIYTKPGFLENEEISETVEQVLKSTTHILEEDVLLTCPIPNQISSKEELSEANARKEQVQSFTKKKCSNTSIEKMTYTIENQHKISKSNDTINQSEILETNAISKNSVPIYEGEKSKENPDRKDETRISELKEKIVISPKDTNQKSIINQNDLRQNEFFFEKADDKSKENDYENDDLNAMDTANEKCESSESKFSEIEMSMSLKNNENNLTYEEPKELSREEINTEYDKKMNDRKNCIANLKRFLADLDTPEEMLAQGQPPAKVMKDSNKKEESSDLSSVISVFQKLVQNQPPKTNHGHWKLERETEESATFSFFLGTMKLNFVLGHSIPTKDASVKHWAIRKATINIIRHKEAEQSVKLVDFLLLKEWPQDKLSRIFRTTEYMEKGLHVIGESVNKAFNFILEMDDIQSNHCKFIIDDDFKVKVEFHSVPLLLNFAVQIDYAQGFKAAKNEGVELIPLIGMYGFN